VRWWLRGFSTLFEQNEVDSREGMVLESKFASSQSKAFEFVFSDMYFKPYAVNVTDRYQCVVKLGVVACVGCSGILTSE